MAAKLVAEEGILKGLVLSLDNGVEWVIGRDPQESQLLVEDPSASRKHLLCRSTPEGITIENLSMTNPVQVNEEEINGPYTLRQGDTVTIGSGIFRFYNDATAQINHQTSQEEADAVRMVAKENASEEKKEKEAAMDERRNTLFDEESEEQADVLAEINLDFLDTARWLLKVIAGPNNGAEFSMQSDTSYVIGTDPTTCDIVFNDVSVSRQHARLTISKEEQLLIEDLKSRNGTLIDGKKVTSAQALEPNALVSIGTTTFVVFDRENERNTIISPLLPAIVKVLQKEEEKKEVVESKQEQEQRLQREKEQREREEREKLEAEEAEKKRRERGRVAFGTLIIVAIISGLLVIVGLGTVSLFKSQPIEITRVDIDKSLETALAPYPSIKWSFNKSTGRLLLVGHVLTAVDRNQLLYTLQTMPFITSLDYDNVIVDEYIWQEANQILAKNPSSRSITVHSPSPGRFVMTGYLRTRKQAEELSDYMNQNFPYLDLLEKRIIVEEDLVAQIAVALQESGFRDILVKVNNGEVNLSGNIPFGQKNALDQVIGKIKNITGVRTVNNLVAELPTEEAIINISDNYRITGSSTDSLGNINVVIKGRILSKDDNLDGMKIIKIDSGSIFLEKEGSKYRIDYNH